MQTKDYRRIAEELAIFNKPPLKDVIHLTPDNIIYEIAYQPVIPYSVDEILELGILHKKIYVINGHEYDAEMYHKLYAQLMEKELEISSSIDTSVKDTDYIMDSLDAAVSEEAIRYYTDYE